MAAALAELVPSRWREAWPARLLRALSRPAGLASVATAPALASYSSVLLSHTAVPAWNEARDELPFVFVGSAAASSGGLGMLCTPLSEARPARAFATAGAAGELVASRVMEHRMGLVREAYQRGTPGRLRRAALQRFAVFHAGVDSTKDPAMLSCPSGSTWPPETPSPNTLCEMHIGLSRSACALRRPRQAVAAVRGDSPAVEREPGLHCGACVGGGLYEELAAEGFDAVFEAEEAGSVGEVGAAAAVVVDADLQGGVGDVGVDGDADGDGGGLGVFGGVGEGFGDDVVGGDLDVFG